MKTHVTISFDCPSSDVQCLFGIDMTTPPPTDRIMRLDEVAEHVGVHKSTILRWEKAGEFPPRIELSDAEGGVVGWRKSTVEKWLSDRAHKQA